VDKTEYLDIELVGSRIIYAILYYLFERIMSFYVCIVQLVESMLIWDLESNAIFI